MKLIYLHVIQIIGGKLKDTKLTLTVLNLNQSFLFFAHDTCTKGFMQLSPSGKKQKNVLIP